MPIFHHAAQGEESVSGALRGRGGIFVHNINRVTVALTEVNRYAWNKMDYIINRSLKRIHYDAVQRVPFDTGELLGSIRVERAKIRGRYRLEGRVKAQAKYAAWVEFGTWKQTKKKKGAKMPPARPGDPLAQWASRHGLVPFLVARSIGRPVQRGRFKTALGRAFRIRARTEGTKKQPFLGPAFVAERPHFYRSALNLLQGFRSTRRVA